MHVKKVGWEIHRIVHVFCLRVFVSFPKEKMIYVRMEEMAAKDLGLQPIFFGQEKEHAARGEQPLHNQLELKQCFLKQY